MKKSLMLIIACCLLLSMGTCFAQEEDPDPKTAMINVKYELQGLNTEIIGPYLDNIVMPPKTGPTMSQDYSETVYLYTEM